MKTKEYMNDLMLPDICEEVATGYDGYISDAIMEVADSWTSIYYSDIDRFAQEHPELMRSACDEGLAMGGAEYFHQHPNHDWEDYTRYIAQCAEYMFNEDVMYDNLSQIVMYHIADRMLHEGHTELTEDDLDALEDAGVDVNSFDTFDEVDDRADEIMGKTDDDEDVA